MKLVIMGGKLAIGRDQGLGDEAVCPSIFPGFLTRHAGKNGNTVCLRHFAKALDGRAGLQWLSQITEPVKTGA